MSPSGTCTLLQRGGCRVHQPVDGNLVRVDFWYSFILLTPACGWAKLEVVTPRPLQAMSEEQLKAFWEAVQADAGLQEKLKAAADANAVAAIAKEAGFSICADDLKNALNAQSEISDEELEGVAGGHSPAAYNAVKVKVLADAKARANAL